MTVRLIVIATVLLVATACAESAATSVPVDAQPSSAEPLLLGTGWQLVDAVVEGEHVPLDGIDAVLRFDEDGGFSATACNFQRGEVALALTSLTLTPEFKSAALCVDRVMEVDDVFYSMFGQVAQWSVVNEQLTLIGPATLTFRSMDSNRRSTESPEGKMAVPGSGQRQRMPVPLRALSAVAVIPHELAAAQRWVVNRRENVASPSA